jgi:CRP-like cAMP-binding protein
MIKENSVTDLLQKVALFKDTPLNVLEELGSHIVQRNYKTDELIIQKGDVGDSLFIIASGSVKVHDEEQIIATLFDGNFFGEISLLDSAPRSMSVTAAEPAELYNITAEDFYQVFRNQPEVTKVIVSTLTRRLRRQNETTIQQLRSREEELSKLVDERTKELSSKNKELSETLDELKATQIQLIQQEKLASLGQLTAGIAHEIQNPLNFVTNFSKLSVELMNELESSTSDEEKKEIANDLKQNLERINHHGKRADSIVKGMLEAMPNGPASSRPTRSRPKSMKRK